MSGLADRTYQVPSQPVPELSQQPLFEVRGAVVPYSEGVYVLYRCFYDDDEPVDLLDVNGFGPEDFA